MKRRGGVIAFKVLLFLIIVIAGFGQAVLQLWNWLMPSIFGLATITFWQAVGLLGLSWLLFGGWRGFHGARFRSRGQFRQRLLDRWEKMTPEERTKLREGIGGHWGHGLRN